jgi:hypothetical protein
MQQALGRPDFFCRAIDSERVLGLESGNVQGTKL